VSKHLSSQQISEWMIGERSPKLAQHLQSCPECAEEVARASAAIGAFGSAVRGWSRQQMAAFQVKPAAEDSQRYWNTGMFRWQVATASMAALLLAAIPVYRHQHQAPQNTAPAAVAASVNDEALLRDVEAAVSRSVPAPMEPLDKLMAGETSVDRRRSE
jgi:hypothetical protein